MEESTGQRSTLTKPRYSFLDLGLLAVLLLLALAFGVKPLVERIYLQPTPIAPVSLAPLAPKTGAKAYQNEYQFSDDMFTHNIPVWEAALAPYKGKPDLNYLEIGVHEGRSVMWMLENVLTDPTSRLTGIDVFADEYKGVKGGYKAVYLANLEAAGASDRATTIESFSQLALRELPLDSFDIIYIDGSHANDDVLEDAILSSRLLKKGGLMIFDDYGGEHGHPKFGIDTFYEIYGDDYDTLHNGYQIILRKKA
ncbi:hypothetical protein Pan216_27560 [Planctomycetes bacterium Pan216]|uniref:Methyltransferase domain protein n=1 Tax=Kolteria novifilia TaxID=2527975 RepID=A0A518B4H8_9BACT|nr:hypothetical protein Pan216_27560 [Planctomycetes bacterium Pan216]